MVFMVRRGCTTIWFTDTNWLRQITYKQMLVFVRQNCTYNIILMEVILRNIIFHHNQGNNKLKYPSQYSLREKKSASSWGVAIINMSRMRPRNSFVSQPNEGQSIRNSLDTRIEKFQVVKMAEHSHSTWVSNEMYIFQSYETIALS